MPPKLARQLTHELPQPTPYLPLHPTPSSISSHRLGPNIYCRFITTWSRLQEDHLHQHDQSSGKIENWETQNDAWHSTDASTHEPAKHELGKQEMMALYEHHHKVVPRDQDLFYSTTEEHFVQETMSQGLQQWLNTWKPVLLQSIQEGTSTGTNEMHDIRCYFRNTTT